MEKIAISGSETPIREIVIYTGDQKRNGVYYESLTKLKRLFKYVHGPWKVREASVEKLNLSEWQPQKTLFILPGGVASQYDIQLREKKKELWEFVEQGGFFYAVCGGSYFASSRTIYHLKENETLNRIREYPFFQGLAEGPVFPSDNDEISFHHGAATIRWNSTGLIAPVLVSGGGGFIADSKEKNYEVLASYVDSRIPEKLSNAVVKNYVGKGIAILSSLHLGYHASDIDLDVYCKLFPNHHWKEIISFLEGTEAFRIQCFAQLLLEFQVEKRGVMI